MALLSNREFPRVNGTKIHAIYGRMNTAYSATSILDDAYDKKPDYYLLCTKETHYVNGSRVQKKDIKVKELPEELAQFFGPQEVNGNKVYVTRMYIRESPSNNGSFTDQTLDFAGGCGVTGRHIYYYRLPRWKDAGELSVFKGEELGERYENTFIGKSFTVDVLPDDYNKEYPCVYIRKIGNLNYPDVKVSGWRWLYGSPYVRNESDPKSIRVFSESLNAHVFLEEVEPQKGDEDLIYIDFSRQWDDSFLGQKGDYFCHIRCYNNDNKDIVRYNILKVEHHKQFGTSVNAVIVENGKNQHCKDMRAKGFYRLVRIQNV